MTVGVLALQGDFREHIEMLARLGVTAVEVRQPKHLAQVERLIIPGGESTTIGKLLARFALEVPLAARIAAGMPVWGTCAGAILLAREIAAGRPGQMSLASVDIVAQRNAFGSQLDSFETQLTFAGQQPAHAAVFIRAPVLSEPGPDVQVLARLDDDRIVAAQQGRVLLTCFHPELTRDDRVHQYFLAL